MEDISEKEQLDQMRAWWSEYGNYVVGGIVIGIAIIVGIGQYRSHAETAQTEASALYESVTEAAAVGKLEDAETAASELFADYTSTVYPSQARLALARLYMDRGRDQDAADALSAVVEDQGDSELGLIAKLRLAKVLLYQNKPQEVVDLLGNVGDTAYKSRFSETLGDARVMLGEYAAAQESYLKAMADSASMPTIDRALVQMKIDDLPDLTELAEREAADTPDTDIAGGSEADTAAADTDTDTEELPEDAEAPAVDEEEVAE